MEMKKIALAITGASGSIYAKVLLDKLTVLSHLEIALVMTENAKSVWHFELENEAYANYPVKRFEVNDYFAPFASGSSSYEALVICPCSMGTIGRIANGISENLITRAADVMLKERRTLICVARDTPYNLIHLRNMETITQAGGIICPASPSFYSKPKSMEEMASTVVDRVIGLLGVQIDTYRWSEE
jgi:4-hydroxy-3-polyprenylbenzoate decarboxylase